MIQQMYLLDPASDAKRAELDSAIEAAQQHGCRPELLATLKDMREQMTPRLVPYDPRVHP
jgi:hypothetical protein